MFEVPMTPFAAPIHKASLLEVGDKFHANLNSNVSPGLFSFVP